LPPLLFEQLPNEEATDLDMYLCQPLNSPGSFSKLSSKLIIVYCDRDAEFAVKARQDNPMARLGASVMSLYAMVWTPDKYVLWHEALHLLDVPDSYNESGQTICKEQNCIMQWNPNEGNCGGDLVLCQKTIKFMSAALRHN